MNFCIVVARYNENIEWSKTYENVIIYNKGEELVDCPNQILLTNVGREGHSYYTYIYNNYENLKDYTIFLQGDPFCHSKNLIKDLNNYINNKNLDIGFEFLSDLITGCNLTGCIRHGGLPLIDTYEKIFGERKESMKFEFGGGAQFIVSKKNILKRPKSFYLKIIEILQHDINPIEGFVIERFHKLIFE
jgi:hypothetical protein